MWRSVGLYRYFSDHFGSMYRFVIVPSPQSGVMEQRQKVAWGRIVFHLTVPLVVGGLSWWNNLRLLDYSPILVGTSILAGGLFAILPQIMSLSFQLKSDGKLLAQDSARILVNELRSNVTYAACVAVLTALVVICSAAFDTNKNDGINVPVTAIVALLASHLLLTLLYILKRFYVVYDGLSGSNA